METLLAFGQFSDHDRSVVTTASLESASDLHFVGTMREAATWRASHAAYGMIVDMGSPDSESLALETRSESRLAQLPILAIAADGGELSFAEAYAWGADDVVRLERVRPLMTRLRSLPHEAPAEPKNGRGTALVADPDRSRRILLGRVLRNAGYTVDFAADAADAKERSRGMTLVVVSSELGEAPRSIIEGAAGAHDATWIVTCPPRELGAQRAALSTLDNVAATDGYGPAENVLFLSNELSSGARANQRASQRLLYGTSVAFRGAGREEDDHGFCYNISEGGLYVRTLAPPEEELVWLELTPPRSERRVRLVGRVVWRRPFGPSENATVPPGFGVQIVDGAAADREAWLNGYRAFAEALG
jgi:DNA-binding response OmpR family regulator